MMPSARAARLGPTKAASWSVVSSPDRVADDTTRANGQPSAAASAPSVDGRSPAITPRVPNRASTRATVGGSGLPATSGRRPAAVATAATRDPLPGRRPAGAGEGGAVLVGTEGGPG